MHEAEQSAPAPKPRKTSSDNLYAAQHLNLDWLCKEVCHAGGEAFVDIGLLSVGRGCADKLELRDNMLREPLCRRNERNSC